MTATQTTVAAAKTFATMDKHCVARYGYGLLQVETTVAMWVAENFGGYDNWKTIARRREKAGRGMTFPTFGSVCFPVKGA
jgi:hypothetical protein